MDFVFPIRQGEEPGKSSARPTSVSQSNNACVVYEVAPAVTCSYRNEAQSVASGKSMGFREADFSLPSSVLANRYTILGRFVCQLALGAMGIVKV
jgi:hypothetical protein